VKLSITTREQNDNTISGSGGPNKDAERDIERLGLQGVDEGCSKKQNSDHCFGQKIICYQILWLYTNCLTRNGILLSA